MQWFAAGNDDLQSGRRGQQCGNQRGGRHQVLEIIDQQEHIPLGQDAIQGVQHRFSGAFKDPQCPGNRFRHQRRIGQGGQIHKPYAVGESLDHIGRDLDRQPRLAGPARSGKCQQARPIQQLPDARHFSGPADKGCQLYGEVLAGSGGRRKRAAFVQNPGTVCLCDSLGSASNTQLAVDLAVVPLDRVQTQE